MDMFDPIYIELVFPNRCIFCHRTEEEAGSNPTLSASG
jgi:hypothetical protein